MCRHNANNRPISFTQGNTRVECNYDYRPYGALLWSEESIPNPIQYSSEIHDFELGLISYNYRHYNPLDGGLNLYGFVGSI